MAQPTAYSRAYDFEAHSTNYPTTPQPGVELESEFDGIKVTTDEILASLALIQKDDGTLANDSVGINQLKAEVTFGLNAVSNWLTATAYTINDGVWQDRKLYRALATHTSGVFATDLGNAEWELLVDHDQWLTAGEAAQTAAEAAQTAAEAAQTAAALSADAASTAETNAETAETNAAASADAAAASAASIDLPNITGNSLKFIRANAGETANEYAAIDIPVAASTAEIDTGTDADKFVTPDDLAASDYGLVQVPLWVTSIGGSAVVGDGANYFDVQSHMDGMNLVGATATVITAGTTGSSTINIYNVTQATDMLSTAITIASAATVSDGNEVIDAANDDIATGDILRVDVDTVSTTPPIGVRVNLLFRKP